MVIVQKLRCLLILLFINFLKYLKINQNYSLFITFLNKFHINKLNINRILIIMFLFACGENLEVHISQTVIFDGKLYKMDSEKPFSGIVYNTYSNGQREYEGKYKDGKPNGLLTYWFENGFIMREGKLKNGSPFGLWKYYQTDGTIEKTINY